LTRRGPRLDLDQPEMVEQLQTWRHRPPVRLDSDASLLPSHQVSQRVGRHARECAEWRLAQVKRSRALGEGAIITTRAWPEALSTFRKQCAQFARTEYPPRRVRQIRLVGRRHNNLKRRSVSPPHHIRPGLGSFLPRYPRRVLVDCRSSRCSGFSFALHHRVNAPRTRASENEINKNEAKERREFAVVRIGWKPLGALTMK